MLNHFPLFKFVYIFKKIVFGTFKYDKGKQHTKFTASADERSISTSTSMRLKNTVATRSDKIKRTLWTFINRRTYVTTIYYQNFLKK